MWIKSVSESLIATFLTEGISNCFSPQTPVIFSWDFGTREMLLTAMRPEERELADFDRKKCEIKDHHKTVILNFEVVIPLRAYSCLVKNKI